MRTAGMLALGWLVPGGPAFVRHQYARGAAVFFAVSGAFGAGVALRGANLWPSPQELAGADGLTALMARAGAAAKIFAGGPWLLAHGLGYSTAFPEGRLHEQGTMLLLMAGLVNLLALVEEKELMPHLIFSAFLAALVSVALSRRGRAGHVFATCMITVIAGSWAMYLIHG